MQNENYAGPTPDSGPNANEPLMADLDTSKTPLDPKFIDKEAEATYVKEVDEIEIRQSPKFVALTKAELAEYENDPFWRRLRMILFILFWLAWIVMFAAAIAIVIVSPKCPPKPQRLWWQKKICYQLYTRSFKDSDGNGVGDIKGIIQQVDKLKDIGIQTIWPTSIISSRDYSGYEVLDHGQVDSHLGTQEDFDELIKAVGKRDMYLVLDFVTSATSKNHTWFLEAAMGKERYLEYYYFQDTAGPNANMWTRLANGKFYRHWPSKPERPLLNLDSFNTQNMLLRSFRSWLDRGVNGFYLFSHYMSFKPNTDEQDWEKTLVIMSKVREEVNRYQNDTGKLDSILLFTSIPDEVEEDIRLRLITEGLVSLVSNTELKSVDATCEANCVYGKLDEVLNRHLKYNETWPLWEIGDPFVSRVSSRTGSRERGELMELLLLTLPGSINNYYGDEIGLFDVDIKDVSIGDTDKIKKSLTWRSPMQWTDGNLGGFSDGSNLQIQMNADFKENNFEKQVKAYNSGLKNFKKITTQLRQYDDTFLYGEFKLGPANSTLNNVLTYTLSYGGGFTFIGALNFNKNSTETADLSWIDVDSANVVVTTTNLANRNIYSARSPQKLTEIKLAGNEGILLKYKAK